MGKIGSFTLQTLTIAFMLRLLPSHAYFCGIRIETTDHLELDIAEKKLIQLAQTDSFPVEMKLLACDEPNKSDGEIASYSPFLDPAGILRSAGRISRLVGMLVPSLIENNPDCSTPASSFSIFIKGWTTCAP